MSSLRVRIVDFFDGTSLLDSWRHISAVALLLVFMLCGALGAARKWKMYYVRMVVSMALQSKQLTGPDDLAQFKKALEKARPYFSDNGNLVLGVGRNPKDGKWEVQP